MLSYQHAYHAGNPADVHKHLALVMLLRRLQDKDTPLCYVDSHAGRGLYDMYGDEARKTGEAALGIVRLAAAPDVPPAVRDYLDLVALRNTAGALRYYPGSPALAQSLLRDRDCAILLELHPREAPALKRALGRDRRIGIHVRDCFEGLTALLPPPSIRRGVVLIDPSYEVKDDYDTIPALVGRALGRWANAVYLVWYPLLAGGRHTRLLDGLARLAPPQLLVCEYRFGAGAVGLPGSGLAIVNPPWQFDAGFDAAMAHVIAALDGSGSHAVQQR